MRYLGMLASVWLLTLILRLWPRDDEVDDLVFDAIARLAEAMGAVVDYRSVMADLDRRDAS